MALSVSVVQTVLKHCPCNWRQVRELLAKLQAVFDLPRRLRTAIDRGARELAVGYYADAAPLLHRYGHKVPLSAEACWLC